jgi:hypothetical protein
VAYRVEGLCEVHDENISLFAIFNVPGYVICEFKKLCFTGFVLFETMKDEESCVCRHGS